MTRRWNLFIENDVLLLPFLLYSCCHFHCTVIAIFAVFLITCYNRIMYGRYSRPKGIRLTGSPLVPVKKPL